MKLLDIEIPKEGLKLNLGAGSRRPAGHFCIDAVENPDAPRTLDLVSYITEIPLPDECASEITVIHAWEHLYRWECEPTIKEWRRLLRPGGLLIMEMPDLMKFCKNILDGAMRGGKHPDQLGMWAAYGDPRTKDPHMTHKWAWSPQTLESFLKENGFIKITHLPTVHHPAGRHHRDLRIEARKPQNA